MNYEVDWTDEAIEVLTEIWTRDSDRPAITAAQAAIDRLLAANPLRDSTPGPEGLFILEIRPLRVQFELSDTDRLVTVVSVRRLP